MKVYAPADRPLVMVAAGGTDVDRLQSALSNLLGGVALLALLSALVQVWLRGLPFGTASNAGGDGAQIAAETTSVASGAAGGLPPGLLFFFGGLAVLLVGFATWYVRR
jgi:hypothetical protein